MRRSGVRKLKGLRRVRQDGKLYVYHRATGIRMPDLPEDHPDFLRAYLAAESGEGVPRRRAEPGSLAAVWQSYLRSDQYRLLSDSYRDVRRRDGDKLIRKGGQVPMRSIRASHIRNDLDELEPHPARERRKTWRAICAHAVARG